MCPHFGFCDVMSLSGKNPILSSNFVNFSSNSLVVIGVFLQVWIFFIDGDGGEGLG